MAAKSSKLDKITSVIDLYRGRLAAMIVHLNDTYLVDERPDQKLPGFARVTATIKYLREYVRQAVGEDRTLVLHSGDFLVPSRVGKETRGRLMIQLLNEMGLDYCLLGNHEFDYGDQVLKDRLGEGKFGVLLGNASTNSIPLISSALWPSEAAPFVALTGIVSKSVFGSFGSGWTFTEPWRALHQFSEQTKHLPFRLVLTHAKREEDREIRNLVPGRTYFLGGHDHDMHWAELDGCPIYKNLSNLQTVRVILLLAGGASAWMRAFARHEKGHPDHKESRIFLGRKTPPDSLPMHQYRQYLDWVFETTHPVDAAVLRRGIPADPPKLSPKDISDVASNPTLLDPKLLFRDRVIDRVLQGIPNTKDEISYILRRMDHLPFDPSVQALIKGGVADEGAEDQIVCDFTESATVELEARDEVLRRCPTDFGIFVAQCVLKQTGADFVLLNAGTFRCDALLPRLLRLRELKDTFLYDSRQAVVVLDLPRNVLAAALEHGLAQTGSGAFPQTFPEAIPDQPNLRTAISQYLVGDAKSIDGYDRVIAEKFGISVQDLHQKSNEEQVPKFSIIEALIAHASNVAYRPVASASTATDEVSRFIEITDRLSKQLVMPLEQSEMFDWLQTDKPLDHPEIQACRDELRSLLRDLPEVKEFHTQLTERRAELGAMPPGSNAPNSMLDLHHASMDRLGALRDELENHAARFRNRFAYHKVLDVVADGIGGWRT